MEGEEEHHGKKPVFEKVKEKVKKIKDTISKKKHGHGDDNHDGHRDVSEEEEGYEEDDEERLDDPAVHGATGHTGGEKARDVEKAPLKDYVRSLEEDPAAPMSDTSAQRGSCCAAGGEDIGTSPVIQAFEAMTVTDQPPVKNEVCGVHNISEEAAKAPYEAVAEAGACVIEKVQQGDSSTEGGSVRVGSGVRVKLAEKLKPGEEDKALCEVISDAIRKRREGAEEAAAAVTDSNAKSGKLGMMGRLRGAVPSWVGGRRESRASPSIEHQRKETEGDRPQEEIHEQELEETE
ncbi:unnamed protein product [Musa acuminata subsp. malaccensis]|uniref:(wild Malaysian banana) hypothetical protein n=1 Tax=Musa acuminata subsp. malaccensis TaxID=214687 RepID=A0A804IXU1_MUSAM|nr:unnamed protein product [Musa acuminata subsp. malaccensis]